MNSCPSRKRRILAPRNGRCLDSRLEFTSRLSGVIALFEGHLQAYKWIKSCFCWGEGESLKKSAGVTLIPS